MEETIGWILESKFNTLTGVSNQKVIGNKELDTKGDLEMIRRVIVEAWH